MAKSPEPESANIPLPQENPDLVGHAKAELALLNSFESGNFPHAWLISGPAGIGKATLAYRFARFVLRDQDHQNEFSLFDDPAAPADGLYMAPDEPLFQQIARGTRPGLLVIERQWDERGQRMRQEIVVDDIRRIHQLFNVTSANDSWRVVIIDSADELNRNAANALLKILEEPPHQTVLLLVSHAPGQLPATIRSRCRKLKLKPLEAADLSQILAKLLPDFPAEERAEISGICGGSPGQAIRLSAGQGISRFNRFRDLLSKRQRGEGVISELHTLATEINRNRSGEDFTLLMELVAQWLASVMRDECVKIETEAARPGKQLARMLDAREEINHLAITAPALNLDLHAVVLNVFTILETSLNHAVAVKADG